MPGGNCNSDPNSCRYYGYDGGCNLDGGRCPYKDREAKWYNDD